MAEALPPGARELVQRCLATMDHVETLLLLQADGGRELSIGELAERLRLDEPTIARILTSLTEAGLVTETRSGVRFVASPANTAAVQDLAQAYHARPVTLVQAIYSRPAPMTSFTDALRPRDDRAS